MTWDVGDFPLVGRDLSVSLAPRVAFFAPENIGQLMGAARREPALAENARATRHA
jgi:hypothetical protein